MAKSSHVRSGKSRKKKRFFLFRPGFWLTLLVLGIIAGVAAWLVADDYLRPYRERATIYDMARINDLEIPSIIVDRNGDEIGRFFVQNRSIISIDDVPEVFINALMSGEDQRFYQHDGVDYIGIARAAWLNYKGSRQGASTITQQLARNAYNLKTEADIRGESEIERKLVEIFLARRIERHYSKPEILEFYLNRIYFGSGFYGIRSASLGYYGKEPKDLTVEESASLVTLIKNPTGRSPLNNPEANRVGRNYVLGRMHADGRITRRERDEAQATPLKLNPRPLRRGTTHLYERISDAVTRALGEDALESGGFTIHTTILAPAQRAAEEALRDSLARAEKHPRYTRRLMRDFQPGSEEDADFLQGAVLMVDHETGEVLAHVGGRDYARAQYDFIELGRRPLGTAFHPFIHIASLENRNTPVTLVEDVQMDNRAVMVGGREGVLGEWGMEIDNPVYEGEITARRALEASKIAANVRLANQVGIGKVIETAARFGLPMQDAEVLPRVAVGFEEVSLRQVVRAYAAIPRGGTLGPERLVYLDRIVNRDGRTVWPLSRPAPTKPTTATDPATAWQVHDMLAGSLERGSAKGVLDQLIERPFHGGGKTGTSADFSDNWFVGYNSRITCGVWAGFLTSGGESIYPGAFSRDIAMPVWAAAMNAAAPSFGGEKPTAPAEVVRIEVCSVSGQRATSFCQHQVEDLESGRIVTRPTAVTEWFRATAANLPYCTTHSGGLDTLGQSGAIDVIGSTRAINVTPIRPTAPAVLGEDPFLTEVPAFVTTDASTSGLIRRRTNVLDSLELGAYDEPLELRRPPRLTILDE